MAYAYVKTTSNTANANTVTMTATAGNFLVVEVATSGGGGSPTWTGADNTGSTTYQQGFAATIDASGYFCGFRYAENIPGGITLLTLTFNGGTPGEVEIRVHEYSGIATSASLIGTPLRAAQTNPGTGTDAISSGALNVTSQPALVIGMVMSIALDPALVAGTGFTQRSSSAGMMAQDLRATATGNKTSTATSSGGAANTYTSIIAAFAEASGAASSKLLSMISNQAGF